MAIKGDGEVKEQTGPDIYDRWLDQMAKPGFEGGITGKRTRIKAAPGQPVNTASGRWQITDRTRNRILRDMGLAKTEKSYQDAVYRFQYDPKFERQVARHGLLMLDKNIPADASDVDRARMLTKGWYTGNVSHFENVVPKPKSGNKITVGAYADKVVKGMGLTPTSTTPATTPAKSTTYTAASTANNAGRALPNNDPITLTPVTNYVPPKKEDAAVATASGQRPVVGVPITQTQGKPDGWKSLESRPSKFQSIASSTMPYMSNIANMNLRPAGVPQPVMDTPTQFGRISLDSERNDVQSDYRNAVLNNNATLDVNTAVRANMASKAQKFQFMNKINEIETNKNVEIGNAQTTANAAINSRNNDKLYATRMLEAERTNAITQQQAANLANASDKFIAQQNTQSQNDLEDRKMKLMYMNDPTGYFKRLADKYEKEQDQPKVDANGVTIKAMGGKLYTAGRMVKNMKPINIKY